MKLKTINKIISQKVQEFVSHHKLNKDIDWVKLGYGSDAKKHPIVEDFILVSGGCITSMLLNEEPNDFDMYFTSKEVAKSVLELLLKDSDFDNDYLRYESTNDGVYINGVFSGVMIEKENAKPYDPICVTENAVTCEDGVQLILRFCGTAEEIHKNFDFVHCTNYWTNQTGLVVNQPALESIITKELKYMGSRFPICSIIRTRKFIKRGWNINAGQYLKMAIQVSDYDLRNPKVLRDQLIGVDVAYFLSLLRKLDKIDLSKVDNEFILDLIDETFDEHLDGTIEEY